MDDLSLLLASKPVFLSLSTQKIKTLKQAEEYLKTNPSQNVQAVVDNYKEIHESVLSRMNNEESLIDFNTVKVDFDEKDPLGSCWHRPTLIEIMGLKGSGKTALSLNLCRQYAKNNLIKTVTILNCAGGITANRLQPFEGINYEYADVFSVEDLQDLLNSLKNSRKSGMLFLDAVNSIIMGASQRIGLGEYLSKLKQQGWCIIVTNLIQGKLQVSQKEIINAQSYFPNIFGSIVDCRLRIDEHQTEQNHFSVQVLKISNCKPYKFIAQMNVNGLGQLIQQK